mgnify:CR=1 FL=1
MWDGRISEGAVAPSRRWEERWRVRVIYYFLVSPDLIFLADLYPKNGMGNLTHAERNALQKIAAEIQHEFEGLAARV